VQLVPTPHAWPQLPQLRASVCVSVHAIPNRPTHAAVPLGQVHAPLTQSAPAAGHAIPHAPQLFGSDDGSVHTPPQSIVPDGHAQPPATQSLPPVHAVPQSPQLAASLETSVQFGPQVRRGGSQRLEHRPDTQDCVAPHACPHVPQLAMSVERFAHAPSHMVDPSGQTHAPRRQLCPGPHRWVQAPQFIGSLSSDTSQPVDCV
jgi:hypothetical protein